MAEEGSVGAAAGDDEHAGRWDWTLFRFLVCSLILHTHAVGYLVRDLSASGPSAVEERDLLQVVTRIVVAAFLGVLATHAQHWSARLGFLASAGVCLFLGYVALVGGQPNSPTALALNVAAVVALGIAVARGPEALRVTADESPHENP